MAMISGMAALPPEIDFSGWGIVAAPRWPGRLGTLAALERHRADGPRGVSPLTIPNVCLHSLSSTISVVFAMQGPNFGVGGGLAGVADGLLAGLTTHTQYRLPGTWMIFSEWDVEPGQPGTKDEPSARALALALGTEVGSVASLSLRPTRKAPCGPRYPRLADLIDCFANGQDGKPANSVQHLRMPWSCVLDWGMELVLTQGMAAA